MDETQRKELARHERQTLRHLGRIGPANRDTATRYIEESRVVGENSVNTLRLKAYHLELLDRETNGKPWGQLGRDDLLAYLKAIQAKDTAPSSRARARQAASGLLRWLYEGNPPAWVKLVLGDRKHRKSGGLNVITEEELRKLLTCEDLTLRTRVLIALLYEGMLRAQEFTALNLGNVTFLSNSLAHVTIPDDAPFCKSGGRTVSISLAAGLLRQWVKVHPRRHEPDWNVVPLVGSESAKSYGARLTYQGVYSAIKHACQAASVRRLRPHLFRHTRITHLIAAGEPESVVKKQSGHVKSSRVFADYVHMNQADVDRMALRELERQEQSRLARLRGLSVQPIPHEDPLEKLARLQMELAAAMRDALLAKSADATPRRGDGGRFRAEEG